MFHRALKLPSVMAVAAGATANLNIPVGPTYRNLGILYNRGGAAATEAQMISDLTKLRLKINGTVRYEVSASDYIAMLKQMGFSIVSGFLPIMLAPVTARTPEMEESLAWGTANVTNLTLEVDIAGAAPTPELTVYAWTTAERRPLNAILQTLPFTVAATGAGLLEVPTLPRGNGDLYRLWIFSANCTAIEVEADGIKVTDASLTFLRETSKFTGRVPQASLQVIEPTWLDRVDDRLRLADLQDFRLKLTMSGAETVRIYMDTVIAPLGIYNPATGARIA